MIYSKTAISKKYTDAILESYIHEPYDELAINKRKAVIVCPGGGYRALSEREGEPIALQYFAAGANAFVLRYSLGEKAADFAPLIEACLAIKYVREHAEEYHIDPDYVYITGFSAGGHLSAWAGTSWHTEPVLSEIGNANPEICKPTATILCYPVISSAEFRHEDSFVVLRGEKDYSSDHPDPFSLECLVDEHTSPAFIWHTFADNAVPVQNSILYAQALANNHIPFELHIYPNGVHGLALCNKETWSNLPFMLSDYNKGWIDLAIKWMDEAPFKN